MSSTVKIILIVTLVCLIGIGGCATAVYFWVINNKDRIVALGEEAKEDGEAFASQTDQRGCLDEAVRRNVRCDGLICEVGTTAFLRFCLDAASETAGFCDEVPEEKSILDTVGWRLGVCADLPDPDKERCGRMVAAWQRHCHPDRTDFE